MTRDRVIEILEELEIDFAKFAKKYPFIKEYKITYMNMGQYQTDIYVKEAEYIMNSMLPKTMVQELEETFKWFSIGGLEYLTLRIIVE